MKLGPGARKTYKVKFALPAGLAAGNYYLSTSLNVSALGDATASDGQAVSASPLVVR